MSTSVIAANFWDAEYLDEYEIPFGDWVQDAINWIVNNLGWLLDAIEWPIRQLLDIINDDILQTVPWPFVVGFVVVLGTLTRGPRIGILSGAGLVVCGMLGDGFWGDTMLTIAMILTAVLICVVIGLPLGIAAGRSDRVSSFIRPVLDAMQTIHPFVWLVPVVFFWGVRQVPGVIATVIFALPPIVRLTDLGIRQVPEDVVEAGRAYGSTERQLLFDIQLPLARRTIMAGLNQTLMLALSMVVIAALLAAGGLGQQILRGVQTTDIPLAASAGVAVLIVAMVLDRLSQQPRSPSGEQPPPSLFKRFFGRGSKLRSGRSLEAANSAE
ncbi:MAG: ABC transporter permease subunit [Acidimicrobiales bacterium]|nr:ABC transporter permease subunit [Acidimicrobiales bacterium]